MADRIDHHHDHETEGKRDSDGAERVAVLGIGDDRAASGEDERERRETLGERAAA